MKKIKYLLLLLIISVIGIPKVWAKSNPYPHYENLGFGNIVNCTWYAWEETKNRMGIELPTWYNVWTWHTKAASSGFSTGKEPRANSLMIWNYGKDFGGHVAYVTSVNGSTITYDEGGSMMSETGIATNQTITLEEVKAITSNDYGFIYLDIPRVTTTKKTTTKKTTTKTTTSKKTSTSTSTSTSTVTSTSSTSSSTTTTVTTKSESTTIDAEKIKDKNPTKKIENGKNIIIICLSFVIILIILLVISIIKRKK